MAITYLAKRWTDGAGEPLSAANIQYIDNGVKQATDEINRIGEKVPFKFGVDSSGNYGYIKDGADTVIPFNRYYKIPAATLQSGLKNATYTTNQYHGSYGFICNGTVGSITLDNYCGTSFQIDATNWDTLYFAYKKNVDHGQLMARVYDSDRSTVLKYVSNSYHTNSTEWCLYKLDLSDITGIKYILLHGGYADGSGSASSQSVFSEIWLSWGSTPPETSWS